MPKIVIVHFQPIENYPPTTNFIDFISQKKNLTCLVLTNISNQKRKLYHSNNIFIKRISQEPINGKLAPIFRILYYLKFNLIGFLRLMFFKPEIILYYESYSALPVYYYMRLFGKKKILWMHSHEYFPPDWYQSGMRSVKAYHKLEKNFLYPKAKGLSQTNGFRAKFFQDDNPLLSPKKIHVFPNFPPRSWENHCRDIKKIDTPVRIVYIGSVSMRATYIKEFCEWVSKQKGSATLDVFTTILDQDTKNYFMSIQNSSIKIHNKGILYKNIPEIIQKGDYHVGLIFYKGLYTNTVYCASNKLFEYLACGLDVWLTDKMIGSLEYVTKETYPKVTKINYESLKNYSLKELIDHKGLKYRPSQYFCDEINKNFWEKLIVND